MIAAQGSAPQTVENRPVEGIHSHDVEKVGKSCRHTLNHPAFFVA